MHKKISILFFSLALFACGHKNETSEATKTLPASDTAKTQVAVTDYATEHFDAQGMEHYFASARIDSIIKHKPGFNDEDEAEYVHDFLDSAEMAQLNARELLYYCCNYPAAFEQSCADSYDPDSTPNPKIVAHFYFDLTSLTLSEKQKKAIDNRKDSIVLLVKDYIKHTPGKLDEDALVYLSQLDPIGSIPFVIENASETHLVNYTYLLVQMHENKFAPFEKSEMCRQLYGDSSWQFSKIEATPQNCKTIIQLAREFYKLNKAKV